MTFEWSGRLRDGAVQGLAALAVAALTASIIAASAWGDDELIVRLTIVGLGLFAIALALGSSRIVGTTSLLVLGSALASSATADNPAWVRSIVVGCLWYVAVELAWDSIERRDGAKRALAVELRRINEVLLIVVVSLVVTVSAYAASTLDVPRTLFRQVVLAAALIAALVFALRQVVRTAPATPEEPSGR